MARVALRTACAVLVVGCLHACSATRVHHHKLNGVGAAHAGVAADAARFKDDFFPDVALWRSAALWPTYCRELYPGLRRHPVVLHNVTMVDAAGLPVYVLSHNNPSHVRTMVRFLRCYNASTRVVDMASTFEPHLWLLAELQTMVDDVVMLKHNQGPHSVFRRSFVESMPPYFAVTDADVRPHPDTPPNFLSILATLTQVTRRTSLDSVWCWLAHTLCRTTLRRTTLRRTNLHPPTLRPPTHPPPTHPPSTHPPSTHPLSVQPTHRPQIFPNYKAGFALDVANRANMLSGSYFKNMTIADWEAQFWLPNTTRTVPGMNDPVHVADIDTTFAVYNRDHALHSKACTLRTCFSDKAVRVAGSMTSTHTPWHWYAAETLTPGEFQAYYLGKDNIASTTSKMIARGKH